MLKLYWSNNRAIFDGCVNPVFKEFRDG